ncbi:MAG: hypothetical protein AAF998_11065 [Bacteroidota bacterium]
MPFPSSTSRIEAYPPQKENRGTRFLRIALYVLIVPPLAWTASLFALYCHAAYLLGHFPHYNFPDPEQLFIYDSYAPVVDSAFSVWFLSFIPWLILLITAIALHYRRTSRVALPILLGGIARCLAVGIALSEIFTWYGA